MNTRQDLVYREDYFDDPAGWAAVKDLLATVFEIDISPLDLFGGHDTTSMPSAYFDAAGRCVANFSAFSMPLEINGRRVNAAGLQSGAVLPEHRGQGLFRDLVHRTISRCDERGYEAIVLYTDKPGLYEPYGFVTVPEHRFVGPAPTPGPSEPSNRILGLQTSDDLALMQGLLATRTPVSHRFAVSGQAKMFLLSTVLVENVTVSYLDRFDAAVAWQIGEDGAFELLDVVGAEIPSLSDILQALGIRPERVVTHFAPDRLTWAGESQAETGDLRFMMRAASSLLPTRPFRLSPMAEF